MADTFSKPSNGEQKLNWAKIWFKKFMKFHNIEFAKGQQWDFSTDQVIAYLRSRRDEKTPAWKRLKILDGLISYRASVQERSVEFLLPLEHRLDRFSRTPFSKSKLKQCRGAS